ncbi:MAG: DUF3850 domain-containing protein [Lachnospiraceae bacterium]|nr:DUF3850 domain-containing protein [Lachnospiraceae bacterium]
MTHELKIIDKYFIAVRNGTKNFELRKNDRNFNVGDILILWKVDENGNRTGEYLKRKIMYILQDCPEYGLKEGYCILSLGYMWEVIK